MARRARRSSANKQHAAAIKPFYVTGCEKRCFHTRAQAAAFAKQAEKKRGDHGGRRNMRPYRCEKCGHWHVGHLPTAVVSGHLTAADYYKQSPPPRSDLPVGGDGLQLEGA